MQSVTFRCPCGQALRADVQMVGRKAKCSVCQKLLIIPAPEGATHPPPPSPVAEPVAQAKGMKWYEPRVMRRARSKPASWWVRAGIILGAGVACVALRAVIPQSNRPWPYWAVFLLGLGLGVMGFFVRYMATLVPTVIIVSRKGINRNSFAVGPGGSQIIGLGLHVVFWSWDTIGSGRVESKTIGRKRIRVLTLYSVDQEEIGAVGLPLTVSLDALAAEFRARGKGFAR